MSAADDRRLVGRLLGPEEAEVSCEMCFELLDVYVDMELAGGDAAAEMPAMHAHLQGCPACDEDHESLLALAGGSGR
jgi:hypothetical protein